MTEPPEPAAIATTEERGGQALLDISNAVVRIHKEYYGKGPTKARSHLSRDLLAVILEGGFTRSEQTLLEHGHTQEVAASRVAMQESAEQALRAAVEEILGRKIRSFMSANDAVIGVQAEIFLLEPQPYEGEHDRDLGERARRAREQHQEILDEHRALRAEQVQARRGAGPRRTFEP